MTSLPSDRRRQLENVVQRARDVAEAAARAAVNRLDVASAKPWDGLTPEERDLRNRLRAHARQLGDSRGADGTQEVERLITEIAYQQWHRMLFARFLAENDLLIHPELGVPVTLEECDELAPEEGAADGWELAGRFASRMLPQIFRPDDPALALDFAPEHQRELEQLLESIPAETFTASDALGWVYQFWQSKKKDEVNRSGVKIGADELPAVTQLFTEPYMVQFLLHNTLGAWWVGRHPGEELPVEMEYLRRLDDGTPAAGTFDGWPKTAREITVLDPCCGSGHFLVAAFHILVAFRTREEGLSPREACDAVLRDNLFGLELDERCTQIAAFALALAAWTYPAAGGYRPLPELNIACSGLAVGAKREEWLALANGDERLREGMGRLYDLFRDAPTLGSLIDPRRGVGDDLWAAEFSELQPLLERALERERGKGDYAGAEIGIAAQGVAKAAALLARQYILIVTNVPYLGQGSQGPTLQQFLTSHYPTAKADLATAFIKRSLEALSIGGTLATVSPQYWLFLASYRRLRAELLTSISWRVVARLGTNAFDTISGEIVNVALFVWSNEVPTDESSFWAIDLGEHPSTDMKSVTLQSMAGPLLSQRDQLTNPDSRIITDQVDRSLPLLAKYADSYWGLGSGDIPRYAAQFWEFPVISMPWQHLQVTFAVTSEYVGREQVVYWRDPNQFDGLEPYQQEELRRNRWTRGSEGWGHSGVVISQMGDLHASLYTGEIFQNGCAAIIPKDIRNLPAIWSFCSSPQFALEVRKIDKKLSVTNATLIQVPFDVDHWTRVAEEKYPNGLPAPYSNDPTQWLFKGEVTDTTEPLQVAVARLLGYRWPDQEPDALDELADDDGIVCIPALRGEAPAADRLRALLARAYGSEWNGTSERTLLEQAGAKSKTLEDWLRDEFFEQHFKLFHHRPFIWQIWDGTRGGFSALLNYHQLDRKRLELLTYTYLGDWIRRQEHEKEAGKSGADDRLLRARELQKSLELILEGEPPYDIFVRWKPLEEQPIGWEPDLNDGVRLNIYPFMAVPDVGRKGAGILRSKPNIHWRKDRGKNPPDSPWGEERFNRYEDLPDEAKLRDEQGRIIPRLTNAVKRAAREKMKVAAGS